MRLVLLALGLALTASSALAGQNVSLKSQTYDPDGVITLDELFDNAGPASKVTVAARQGQTTVLDAQLVQDLARRHGLDWANSEGLRRIVVSNQTVTSQKENVYVLTYTRNFQAGEIVQAQDLAWLKVSSASTDAALDPAQVIGMVARRPLRMGAISARHDVSAQVVIKPGDIVTVTYQTDGITLTLQARAIGAAAIGEPVDIQNMSSKKIIQAIATGPAQAMTGPMADQTRPAMPTQVALRQ